MTRTIYYSGAATASLMPAIARVCPNCATRVEVWSAIQSQGIGTLGVILAAFSLVGDKLVNAKINMFWDGIAIRLAMIIVGMRVALSARTGK